MSQSRREFARYIPTGLAFPGVEPPASEDCWLGRGRHLPSGSRARARGPLRADKACDYRAVITRLRRGRRAFG